MAVNIILTRNGKEVEWNEETSIYFRDDHADYWYLWPSLIKKVREETGEQIDLYDNANFSGDKLHILENLIQNQVQELKSIPQKQWKVKTGTRTGAVNEDIFATLNKRDLLFKLVQILQIVKMAIEQNEQVICKGD